MTNNTTFSLSQAINGVSIAIALVIIALASTVIGMSYVSAMSTNQRNQAIDACYQASQEVWVSKWNENNRDLSNTVTKPSKDTFEQCMKEKKLK